MLIREKTSSMNILASCPRCGNVDLPDAETYNFKVILKSPFGPGTYGFQCPLCYESVVKQCNQTHISVFADYDVPMELVVYDAEIDDPVRQEHDPFDEDWAIEFVRMLNDDTGSVFETEIAILLDSYSK